MGPLLAEVHPTLPPTPDLGPPQALMASRAPSLLSGSVPKYPGSLHVRVEVVPRPPPDVITTNAFLNVRPRLPAGYGSGFEKGESPQRQQ